MQDTVCGGRCMTRHYGQEGVRQGVREECINRSWQDASVNCPKQVDKVIDEIRMRPRCKVIKERVYTVNVTFLG